MPERSRYDRKSPLHQEPEAVTYARRKAGLTQRELAQMVGRTRPWLTEIELGTRSCSPRDLLRLAEVLNCPVVVLERKRQPVAPSGNGGSDGRSAA